MRVVLLDRDGVINVERKDYVKSWEEFEWLPQSCEALALLQSHGWHLIIITNQSAINRGFISESILNEIHTRMEEYLLKYNVLLDGIYYCPHRPDENCGCRKPKTGLFEQAFNNFAIERHASWMIGNSMSDLIPALQFGLRTILISSSAGETQFSVPKINSIQPNLYLAAEYILKNMDETYD